MESFRKMILISLPTLFIALLIAPAVVAEDGQTTDQPTTPYTARVTGDDVYVRSGPGTNYYPCGKLNTGDIVTVVSKKLGWCTIVGPEESFSWISKRYVKVDTETPGTGIVTGDNVRVWAGSPYVMPIHSTSLQTKLDTGEKVKLLGEEQGDYYKIRPPQGAYLYISADYIEPYTPPQQAQQGADQAQSPAPEQQAVTEEPQQQQTEPVQPSVVETELSTEAKMLTRFYDLQQQIKQERQKPIAQQGYSEIKQQLAEIAETPNAGKAARYAEFTLKQIERYELAKQVNEILQRQQQHLHQTTERIKKAKQAKLQQIPRLGKYAVIGTLQRSRIYGQDRTKTYYRVVGENGQTLCFAVSANASTDAAKLVGKRVGLVGTIEPHPQTSSAIVKFTNIEKID